MFKYLNYLTIVLLPVYLLKIPLSAGTSINLLDLLLLGTVGSNLLYISRKHRLKDLLALGLSLKIGLALILFGFCGSFIVNLEKGSFWNGIGILKSFLLLPAFFALTVSYLSYRQALSIKNLLYSYLFMSSFLAIMGFFYFFGNSLTFDGRLKLFFNSPNSLAMLLGPGIIILITFLSQKKGSFYLLFLLLLFFHSFSTIATGSQGCFLALAVLVIVLLAKQLLKVNWSRIYLVFLISILLFSGLLLFLTPFLNKFAYTPPEPPTSIDSRIVIYQVTKRLVTQNLLWGTGPGNFEKQYLAQQIYYPPYPQWAVPHPHNNLLLLLAEGGFLAFLGLIVLLTHRLPLKKVPFGTCLLFIFFYFALHGLVDTTIWKNDLSLVFWLVLGILNFYPSYYLSDIE